MLENGQIVMDFLPDLKEEHMKENFLMENFMVKELLLKMVENMLGNGKNIKSTDMELIFMLMEINT